MNEKGTEMIKVVLSNRILVQNLRRPGEENGPGFTQNRFGYPFTLQENGTFVGSIPSRVVDAYIKDGRCFLPEDVKSKLLDKQPVVLKSMNAKQLREYAKREFKVTLASSLSKAKLIKEIEDLSVEDVEENDLDEDEFDDSEESENSDEELDEDEDEEGE